MIFLVMLCTLAKNDSLNIIFERIPKSGLHAALNAGFSHLVSDYFFKVDSDDLLSRKFTFFFKQVYYSLVRQNYYPPFMGFLFVLKTQTVILLVILPLLFNLRLPILQLFFLVIIPICAFTAIDRPVIS